MVFVKQKLTKNNYFPKREIRGHNPLNKKREK